MSTIFVCLPVTFKLNFLRMTINVFKIIMPNMHLFLGFERKWLNIIILVDLTLCKSRSMKWTHNAESFFRWEDKINNFITIEYASNIYTTTFSFTKYKRGVFMIMIQLINKHIIHSFPGFFHCSQVLEMLFPTCPWSLKC